MSGVLVFTCSCVVAAGIPLEGQSHSPWSQWANVDQWMSGHPLKESGPRPAPKTTGAPARRRAAAPAVRVAAVVTTSSTSSTRRPAAAARAAEARSGDSRSARRAPVCGGPGSRVSSPRTGRPDATADRAGEQLGVVEAARPPARRSRRRPRDDVDGAGRFEAGEHRVGEPGDGAARVAVLDRARRARGRHRRTRTRPRARRARVASRDAAARATCSHTTRTPVRPRRRTPDTTRGAAPRPTPGTCPDRYRRAGTPTPRPFSRDSRPPGGATRTERGERWVSSGSGRACTGPATGTPR